MVKSNGIFKLKNAHFSHVQQKVEKETVTKYLHIDFFSTFEKFEGPQFIIAGRRFIETLHVFVFSFLPQKCYILRVLL